MTGALNPCSDRQLFVDDLLIAARRGVSRRWHQPTKHPAAPLLSRIPDGERGWAAGMPLCFGSVLFDETEGLFKMWYGLHVGDDDADDSQSVLAYATSRDGVAWERPSLGLNEYRESTDNNIVRTRDGLSCSVILDERDEDVTRRYKMLFCNERMQIDYAFSADGLRWSECENNPVIFYPPGHDSQNVLYRDESLGKYVAVLRERQGMIADVRPQLIADPEARSAYRRLWQRDPAPKSLRRVGQVESDDLVNWSPKRVTVAADDDDPIMRGELYNMQVLPYEGLRVGFITVFTYDLEFCRGGVQLAFSRDGLNWKRAADREVFLPVSDRAGDFDWGAVYPFQAPLVVGDEIRIYYNGVGLDHNHYRPPGVEGWPNGVGLAVLRLDGFASMSAEDPGTLTTCPLICPGGSLAVNADAEGGALRVEILDEQDVVIAPFDLSSCDRLCGDEVRHTMTWRGGSNLGALAGRVIRLRFHLEQTDLFSFCFA